MTTLQMIEGFRSGVVAEGGTSILCPTLVFRSWLELLAFLPTAFLNALLAPWPTGWFGSSNVGVLKLISGAEVLAITLLLPSIVLGLLEVRRRALETSVLLVGFIGIYLLGVGLLMPNAGTLFRSRLPAIPVLLVLAFSRLK